MLRGFPEMCQRKLGGRNQTNLEEGLDRRFRDTRRGGIVSSARERLSPPLELVVANEIGFLRGQVFLSVKTRHISQRHGNLYWRNFPKRSLALRIKIAGTVEQVLFRGHRMLSRTRRMAHHLKRLWFVA